jgi:hypothetical protein
MDDFLGLNDPTEARADLGPALVVPGSCGGWELRALDEMRCSACLPKYAGGNIHTWKDKHGRVHTDDRRMIFTTEDDQWETDPKKMRDPETGKPLGDGERWRKIMSWPEGIEPCPGDARAWLQHRYALLQADYLPKLRWAREQDRLASIGEGEPG